MSVMTLFFQKKRSRWKPETKEASQFEKEILALIVHNKHDEAVKLISERAVFSFESIGFDEPCDEYFLMDEDVVISFKDSSTRIGVGTDRAGNLGDLIATFEVKFDLSVNEGLTVEEFKNALGEIGAIWGAHIDFEGFELIGDDGDQLQVLSQIS